MSRSIESYSGKDRFPRPDKEDARMVFKSAAFVAGAYIGIEVLRTVNITPPTFIQELQAARVFMDSALQYLVIWGSAFSGWFGADKMFSKRPE